MKFLLPVAREDIADTYEPLVEAMVAAGHEALVVTTAAVEARCRFVARGASVAAWPAQRTADGTRRRHGLIGRIRRARVDIADAIGRYRLAQDLLVPGTVLYGFSTDAEMMRPFMDVADRKGNRVVVGQMAYLPADFEELLRGTESDRPGRMWRHPRSFAYQRLRREIVRRATGETAYIGPRRIWGTTANVLFAADRIQADILLRAGIKADKIRTTGVPFMDMIYRRIRQATPASLRGTLGIPADGPVLLVATKDLSSLAAADAARGQAQVVQWVATTLYRALPGWRLLFKLHPSESPEAYREWLADFPGAAVNRDMNIIDALSIPSALVSFGVSSPSYYAELIGLPHCVLRWPGMIDAGHLANFPDLPVAEDPAGLAAAVTALPDRAAAGGMGGGSAEQFDGNACRRMIRVLEEMEGGDGWPAK